MTSTTMGSAASTRRRGPSTLPGSVVTLICLAVVVLAVIASLTIGARTVGWSQIIPGLLHPDPASIDQAAVASRIPTTITGLLVGACLGVGGALMQAMARNPLADPGLLGVNSGASLFVVLAMALLGWQAPLQIIWCAFAGAAVAVVVGYGAAALSPMGATPLSLALAGAAVTAIATSVITGIMITNTQALDSFRLWQVGSLTAATPSSLSQLVWFALAGALLAAVLTPGLNALALGDDVAQTLGIPVTRTRLLSALAVVLLCGSATALAGPIGFVGLAVPHAVRLLVGTDQRWVVPLSGMLGGGFLLVCDVVGRVLARPDLLEVGVVTAVVGAPIFIVLLRRGKAVAL